MIGKESSEKPRAPEREPPLQVGERGPGKGKQREMKMSVMKSIAKVPTLFPWVPSISTVAYGKSQT